MKQLITLLMTFTFIGCEKCDDETKRFNAELFPTKRKTFYDWDRISEFEGSTFYLEVGTQYFKCEATTGQEELDLNTVDLKMDNNVIVGSDTILHGVNLLKEPRLFELLKIRKETDAFFNSPQYLIQMNNDSLNMKGNYTFKFSGVTVSGAEIEDSTVVLIK